MIYRKSPAQPPRLLLRVVAAGAGAALVAACSSTGDLHGSVFGVMANPDASGDGADPCADGCGLVPQASDAGSDGSDVSDADVDHVVVGVAPCADAGCGLMPPPDSGDDGTAGGGIMVNPDAGTD